MELLAIPTPTIRPGDDLAALLAPHVRAGDIVLVSSKAVATAEGALRRLDQDEPGEEARVWAEKCRRSPAFCQAVLDETKRLQGAILGACPGALLTQVRPTGLPRGAILVANAGLDESNVPAGVAIGWPDDSAASARSLRARLGGECAVLITDSTCAPRRSGVTAITLAAAGLDPLVSEIGREDLFGKPLIVTVEARADQLAVAGNMLMGNAGQSTPAAIVRGHGFPLSDFEGWVPGIEPNDDLFSGLV